ncbi:MAG: lipocalin family protein [Eubacterium sp.]|nr:lipocalin family protein [Eubacterium sp.]
MKNAKKLVLVALMAAVMAFALCACGANVDGTYVVSEYNGQNVDEALAQLKEQGVEMKVEDLGTMTLSDGKNVTVSMMGETKKGTYELKGDTLTITSEDGQTGSATIKDGVITYSGDGTTMKLKKK